MDKRKETFHVLPVEDKLLHIEEGVICHCGPGIQIVENGNWIVGHNAYDGRE